MKRALSWLAAGLFLFGCAATHAERAPSGPAPRPARKVVIRSVLAHTVKLHVYDGRELSRAASGVVVGSETTSHGSQSFVVTNAHVIDPDEIAAPRFTVLTEVEGELVELNADPIALGRVPEMDLALVRVRGVRLAPAELADDDELEPGEGVVVAAAPFGRSISLSGGLISRVDMDPQTRQPSMVKTDAAIGYGASGGGVFSLETGKLMAVVEGYRTAKVGFEVAKQSYSFDVPMPGETFAAPAAKVRLFLQAFGFQRLLSGGVARSADLP